MKVTAESKYNIGEVVRVPVGEQIIEAEITGIQVHVRSGKTEIIYYTDVNAVETVVESHILGKSIRRVQQKPYYAESPF